MLEDAEFARLVATYVLDAPEQLTEPESQEKKPENLANGKVPETSLGEYAVLLKVAKYPPVTGDEHILLAKEIEAGLFAQRQIAKGENPPTILASLHEIVHIGQSAFEKMFRCNLRLVLHIAAQSARSIPLEDRFQAGCEGLDRAIKGWDWKLGITFSTYAVNWIRQTITREIANTRSVIRLPVHVYEHLYWDSEENAMAIKPDSTFFSNRFLQSQVLGMFNQPWQTDAIGDNAHIDWHTVSPQESFHDVDFEMESALLLKILEENMDPREYYVLWARYGFMTGEAMTLDEIGKTMRVTRERVRQIEKKGIAMARALIGDFGTDAFRAILR